jgi:hypothetical protein
MVGFISQEEDCMMKEEEEEKGNNFHEMELEYNS